MIEIYFKVLMIRSYFPLPVKEKKERLADLRLSVNLKWNEMCKLVSIHQLLRVAQQTV